MAMDLPNADLVGASIGHPARRAEWRALIRALHEAAAPGSPLDGWVFHGTSLEQARSILSSGMNATDVLLRDGFPDRDGNPTQRWTTGTYWATPAIAAYYAEDKIEQREEPNALLAIVAARLADVEGEGMMEVDEQSLDCPIETRLGRSAEDIFGDWDASTKSWEDCLRIYGSAVCLSPVGPECMKLITSSDDLADILAEVQSVFAPSP